MEQFEFSIVDILNLHRGWLSQLYFDEHNTEIEIILRLQDRGWIVSVAQLRDCLGEWNLDVSVSARNHHWDTPPSPHDDGKDVSSTKVSPSKTNQSYSRDDPEVTMMYSNRSLPPLPSPSTSSKLDVRPANPGDSSRNDRINLTCHHGSSPSPSQAHQIQYPLDALPSDGPSPLDSYANDEQNHEMLAVGLSRPIAPFLYRRAHDFAPRDGSAVRNRSEVRSLNRIRTRMRRRADSQADEGKK